MICYRDMTFCPYHETCGAGQGCHRALTPEVRAAAVKWWGNENVPICEFTDKPECYLPLKIPLEVSNQESK